VQQKTPSQGTRTVRNGQYMSRPVPPARLAREIFPWQTSKARQGGLDVTSMPSGRMLESVPDKHVCRLDRQSAGLHEADNKFHDFLNQLYEGSARTTSAIEFFCVPICLDGHIVTECIRRAHQKEKHPVFV
jgi:hypothetical protein